MTTVKHAVKNAATRKSPSPNAREVLQAVLPSCQATMTRAPATIAQSPDLRVAEGFSPKTIAVISATNSGMQPGLSAPPADAGAKCNPLAATTTYGAPFPAIITAN